LDSGRGIAVDATGNAYIAGVTYSGSINGCGQIQNPPVFPTTPGAYQPAIAPSASSSCIGCCGACFSCTGTQYTPNMQDAFVTKLNPAGSALVYSTYLGGGSSDEGNGIAVDSFGQAFAAGTGGGQGFPVVDPLPPPGPTPPQGFPTPPPAYGGFVTKFSAS